MLSHCYRHAKADPHVRRIDNLEIHLTHSCNLTCESCSHYSNYGHKGSLSLEEAERWMSNWNRRLRPRMFSLLGGEPSLHSDLVDFMALARRSWPRTHLRLVTNGFFLHRHPALPVFLQRDPDAAIYLSIHHGSPEYQERILPIKVLLKEWASRYNVRVRTYQSHKNWTRRYQGSGAGMEPFAHGKPRQSWENCPARFCPQLFEGKIWKCPPLAYLKLQDAKYSLSTRWQPYLAYEPLAPNCSDDELNAFFSREEESYCSMCAARPQPLRLAIPLASIGRRMTTVS